METIILGWYILVETDSVVLLTLFAALNFTGTLIAPVFGVIGDRVGHRNLLTIMRVAYAGLASTQMALALSGHSTPFFVFMIAAVTGLIRPSDLGVRGALVASIMPHHQLIGAMSLSRTTGDTARIAGALSGAGLFAALGMGRAYVAIVCLYILAIFLTSRISPSVHTASGEITESKLKSPLQDLKEGVVYVWNTPLLRAIMWIAFIANLTAFPLTNGLLPHVARNIYNTDQTVLGYLSASFAAGAFVGSIVLGTFSGVRVARLMITASAIWYALLLIFAHIETVPFAVLCLLAAGFFQSFSMISIAVILMRTASERLRGRVMGVRMLAIYGMPIGLVVAGSLVEQIGYAKTATLYAMIGLVTILVIAVRWQAELWRSDAPANAR